MCVESSTNRIKTRKATDLVTLKFLDFLYFRDPAGARTQDPIIKSDVLYLLSYGISLLLY